VGARDPVRGSTVDSFRDLRLHGNTFQVLVRWLGFDDPEADTWEPVQTIAQGSPATRRALVEFLSSPSLTPAQRRLLPRLYRRLPHLQNGRAV
jgi:hypothetical protein